MVGSFRVITYQRREFPGAFLERDHIIDVFARGSGGGMAALWTRDFNNVVSGDWSDWTFVGQVGP
ncbi:MAG: hypothetical protein ACXW0U_08365 [Halobacteriota archaeon]